MRKVWRCGFGCLGQPNKMRWERGRESLDLLPRPTIFLSPFFRFYKAGDRGIYRAMRQLLQAVVRMARHAAKGTAIVNAVPFMCQII